MTDYDGPAELEVDDGRWAVAVRLSGRLEPVDGKYHWGGRVAPHDDVARLIREGQRRATLRVGDGPGQPVRLTEVDPWGGVLLAATGPAPWTAGTLVEEDEEELGVAIVGAGFAGLGAAIMLTRAGRPDFLVFDAAADVGGTWRDNTYPGCACDVPSHLYSFSFAKYPLWSDTFSAQPQIHAYLRHCVRKFGIGPRLRLGEAVEGAAWDETRGRWRVTTTRGRFLARALILGTGPLSEPSTPDIDGLTSFGGTVFHSARWRHDHDLTGRRVAVIGTGASAVQFVPQIQPAVEHLTLFQRTPAWVLPKLSRRISTVEQWAFRFVPGLQRLARTGLYWARESFAVGFLHPRVNRAAQRIGLLHLRRQVPDPELRAELTPSFVMGCKRVLLSNDYLPAVAQPNVMLTGSPILRATPDGLVTADGVEHRVDTIIFGTGFQVTDPSIARHIRGRAGRVLVDAWSPSMVAYRGTTINGFPNLFVLLGPNTGLGHTSVVLMIEAQLRHILDVLRQGAALEPTEEAQRRHRDQVDTAMARTVWARGGCRSWYVDASGRNSTLWPGYATSFRLSVRRFRREDYRPVETGVAP